MEKTVLDLEKITINGGKSGYLVGMVPADVVRVASPKLVQIGIRDV